MTPRPKRLHGTFTIRVKAVAAMAIVTLAGLGIGSLGLDGNGVVHHAYAQQVKGAAASSVTANGITLRSVSVTLPVSDRTFAGGEAANAINANCLTCHSTEMIMTQPLLTRSAWQQEVAKMSSQYKAPIDASQVPAIVAYLVSHHGPKK